MTLTSRAPDAARPAVARAALGSLTLVLAVAGCTSTPEPSPSPTVTEAVSTPTPAPTPTSTASPKPERPAAMDDVTVEGAIAAATYFISLYPYVYNTGDLTEWKALSHPECLTCAGIVTAVEEMHGQGQRVNGAEISVEDSQGTEIEPGTSFSVVIDMTQGPTVVVDAEGNTVSSQENSRSSTTHIVVIRELNEWLIRAVENETADE